MKLHAQCDRCKRYAEASTPAGVYMPQLPRGWFYVVIYPCAPGPNIGVDPRAKAVVCGDCMPAIEAGIQHALDYGLGR